MSHPNGGKAKFLEDPVRNWAAGKFARTAMTYWKQAITYTNHSGYERRYRPRARSWSFKLGERREAHINFVEQSKGMQRGGEHVRKGEST
jgi:hypothetical protein